MQDITFLRGDLFNTERSLSQINQSGRRDALGTFSQIANSADQVARNYYEALRIDATDKQRKFDNSFKLDNEQQRRFEEDRRQDRTEDESLILNEGRILDNDLRRKNLENFDEDRDFKIRSLTDQDSLRDFQLLREQRNLDNSGADRDFELQKREIELESLRNRNSSQELNLEITQRKINANEAEDYINSLNEDQLKQEITLGNDVYQSNLDTIRDRNSSQDEKNAARSENSLITKQLSSLNTRLKKIGTKVEADKFSSIDDAIQIAKSIKETAGISGSKDAKGLSVTNDFNKFVSKFDTFEQFMNGLKAEARREGVDLNSKASDKDFRRLYEAERHIEKIKESMLKGNAEAKQILPKY